MLEEPVTCYTELVRSLREHIWRLGVRYEDFDVLAGFAAGLSGKVFGPSMVKRLGPEKLFDAIRDGGLEIAARGRSRAAGEDERAHRRKLQSEAGKSGAAEQSRPS